MKKLFTLIALGAVMLCSCSNDDDAPAPKNLRETVTGNMVLLEWDAVENTMGCIIFLNEETRISGTVHESKYLLEHLEYNTKYNYKLRLHLNDDKYTGWAKGTFTTGSNPN